MVLVSFYGFSKFLVGLSALYLRSLQGLCKVSVRSLQGLCNISVIYARSL